MHKFDRRNTLAQESKATETPEGFLGALSKKLKDKEHVDAGLADILTAHILLAFPAQNAVVQAKDAIVKLAAKRAKPENPEVPHA